MKAAGPMQVYLTVDVEPDCPPYLNTFRGLSEGMPRLLDLLAAENIPATFFVTGEVARRASAVIRNLVDAGHALGSHGDTHRSLARLSRRQAEQEIRRSAEALRPFAAVRAFRAPYLQLPDRHLPLLEASGFTCDSSLAKYKPRYYRRPARTSLARLPVSVTSSVLRLPARLARLWLHRLASPVVLFVHPWEFVDLRREKLRWDCRFNTGAPALAALRRAIRLFQARGAQFLRVAA